MSPRQITPRRLRGNVAELKSVLVGTVLTLVAATAMLAIVPASSGGVLAGTWSGSWSTEWGVMTLTQDGSRVEGSYPHDAGHIVGTVTGNGFQGRWDEAPTRSGPTDAGAVEFTMSPDGSAFIGRWSYDGSPTSWNINWTGRCTAGACLANATGTTGTTGTAGKQLAGVTLQVRIGSVDASVVVDPVGQLKDADCPNNVCAFVYPAGTKVTLTAVDTGASRFVTWFGCPSGSSSPTCVTTVNQDGYVRATFSRVGVYYSATQGGHIDRVPAGSSCGDGCEAYPDGATMVVRAVVDDPGFRFDHWGGDCAKVTSTGCRFSNLLFNHYAFAYFARKDGLGTNQSPVVGTSRASLGVNGRGAVSGTAAGRAFRCGTASCSIYPVKGSITPLTAAATMPGWRFDHWSGRCAGAAAVCLFNNQPSPSDPVPGVQAFFVPA